MSLQKFSVFHETSEDGLRQWHRPYAAILKHCKCVLDVGCGPGYFSDELKVIGVESIGVDLDPEMVKLATARGHHAVLGDQDWLASHRQEFDAVHISHVVEHLWGDQIETLLSNATECLKPGGMIVIRTPNWENRFVRERLFWMDHTHKRPYPRELLVRMLEDLNLVHLTSGSEPIGMNDTYVVGGKPPVSFVAADQIVFPVTEIKNAGLIRYLKTKLRTRLRGFLQI